jgi:hypothetical protein
VSQDRLPGLLLPKMGHESKSEHPKTTLLPSSERAGEKIEVPSPRDSFHHGTNDFSHCRQTPCCANSAPPASVSRFAFHWVALAVVRGGPAAPSELCSPELLGPALTVGPPASSPALPGPHALEVGLEFGAEGRLCRRQVRDPENLWKELKPLLPSGADSFWGPKLTKSRRSLASLPPFCVCLCSEPSSLQSLYKHLGFQKGQNR